MGEWDYKCLCGEDIRRHNKTRSCAKCRGVRKGRICSVPGCEREHRARGFCKQHYLSEYRPTQMLPCAIEGCGCVTMARGLCRKHLRATPEYRETTRSRNRERRKNDPAFRAQIQAHKRKENTGFTVRLTNALRCLQAGKCAICSVVMDVVMRKSPLGEHADHCHITKTPRGLLCSSCNTALGRYEKYQKPAGVSLGMYDAYLANPPAQNLSPRQLSFSF